MTPHDQQKALVLEWLAESDNKDTMALRHVALEILEERQAKIERLQAIIQEQRELWELIRYDLNALDDSRHRVRFMGLHNPIGKCKAAEAGGDDE